MSRIFRFRTRIVVSSLLALAGLPGVAYADNAWGCYHWARTSNPFTLKLGDNVSSTWDSYLVTASGEWSLAAVLDTTIVTGGTSARRCRPTSGSVQVCNDTYGNNGWLGLAQIWVSGCHITQAVAKMNDTYFNTSTYNTPAWRRMVMCQEVGHDFGLDHQDTINTNTNLGSCMDYTNKPLGPPSNEHPNNHDWNMLDSVIYAHNDSTTTVSSSTASAAHPPAMNNIDLDGPGQWGRLIRSSHGGRTELYEADFGGGHKVFTFVTWADDAPGRGRNQN